MVVLLDRGPLKIGSNHLIFSVTGQEKSDHLIQVTTWVGLTVLWKLRLRN